MATQVVNQIGIPVSDLTEAIVEGNGVFDVLMRSVNSQLESQFDKNRLAGDNYAKVYLGMLEATQKIALDFLIQRDEAALKALGAAGVIKKGQNVQVVVGTRAELIANEMNVLVKQEKK